MSVHRIYYEVVGEGLPIVEAHNAKVAELEAKAYELAESFGAKGFRPGHGRKGLAHLIFAGKEPPEGWRYVQREADGFLSCAPQKNTKIGRTAAAAMAEIDNPPTGETLAGELGYRVSSFPMDGYKIYFPVAYRVRVPEDRTFLGIPRQAGDGWEPPARLKEVPASTFMLALEAHNAAARAAIAKAEGSALASSEATPEQTPTGA